MAWEPDTEEIRLSENKKSVESLRADQNIMNTSINNNDSSTNMGSLNGQPSFSTGQDGDVVQEVFNDISDVVINSVTYVVGAFETLGSYFTVKPSATNEPTPNCATVKYLKGAVNGQKITLKPQSTKALCLKHNPTSNSSIIGNLYIGSDITLTDSEVITLRFTTELLYTDYKGAWIVESTGSGSGNSTSGVLKDPVKVASTGNNTLHPAWASTIDGIGMVAGDRFLVKDQSNPNEKDNGIYIWGTGALGISLRASDMSDGSVQKEGTMTYVQDGLTQNERLYAINIGGNHITIGTNPNTWGEIGSGSGGGSGAIKSPVKYATTANITLSGEQSIDGTATSTSRVLVKNQTTSSQNGIYVTATGAWARSTDMSTGSTIEGGTMVYVTDGTVNGDNLFGLTTEGTVTVGTGNQAWANLTAGGANTALSNLALTTSINSDLTMQNGFSIANLERVAFNTRTSSGIAGSISYNGTDILAKGSGAEINLTSPTNNWSDITIDTSKDMLKYSLTNLGAVSFKDSGNVVRGSLTADSTNSSLTLNIATNPLRITNVNTEIATFSTTTSDEVNFFGDLDMNQNVIFEVDSIVFDAFSTGNADGKSISTPSGTELLFDLERTSDFFNFKVGGNQKLAIANTNIQSLLPLQMNSNSITDVTVFNMSAYSGSAPTGNGNMWLDGTDVKVRTGGVEKSLSNIGSGGSSGANDTLSNLSSPVAINQTLLPNVASGVIYSLGSSSAKWRHMFTEKLGFGTTAMTMPTTTGTNGQVLTTNGSTTLSWSTASGGATIELDNLGTTSLNAGLNMNTNEITFDADADTSIYSSIDDELLFHTGGSVRLKMENSRFLFSNDITMAGNSGAGTENDIATATAKNVFINLFIFYSYTNSIFALLKNNPQIAAKTANTRNVAGNQFVIKSIHSYNPVNCK